MRVVFDINGVTGYPGFPDVAKIAEMSGHRVNFWTLGDSRAEIPLLEKMGLGHLTKDMIDGRLTNLLKFVFDENDEDLLRVFSTFIGNEDEEELRKLIDQGGKWLNFLEENKLTNGSKLAKYPRILGDGPILFVESDRRGWKNESKRFILNTELNLNTVYERISQESGVTTIIIPEFPSAWEGPNLRIQPRDVINELGKKIRTWDGKPYFLDLGKEMSVYQEGNNSRLERRG